MADKNFSSGAIRCKPGDRARVIGAVCRENIGTVVVVAKPYFPNEKIDGMTWVSNGPAWVVVAVGKLITGRDKYGIMSENRTAVLDDANLVPLDDDDAGTRVTETKKKPRAKKQKSMPTLTT